MTASTVEPPPLAPTLTPALPRRLFGFSEATQYYQIFLGQGVACGLGAGMAFIPAASSVSHWFKKRRATALGILATGSSFGGAS